MFINLLQNFVNLMDIGFIKLLIINKIFKYKYDI